MDRPSVDPRSASPQGLAALNRVAAVAFAVGGSLFALGALLAQLGTTSLVTVNVTYLVGGFFFSLGGFESIRYAARSGADKLGRRSAVVLFVGTLLFAVSLVAAFAQGLTPRQSNGWIWLPDMLGCVCFLVSGRLALVDVGGWRSPVDGHDLGWWVIAVNQIGSVLFFLAGVAAFVRPATSTDLNAGLVNWGTFWGAACFAVGGLLQSFDNPSPTQPTPSQPTPTQNGGASQHVDPQ